MTSTKSRGWVFVINNYSEEEWRRSRENTKASYIITAKEIGESGTPHIQGYVHFPNAVHFNSIKKWLPRAKIILAQGTPLDNFYYCSKGEGKKKDNCEGLSGLDKYTDHGLNAIFEEVGDRPKTSGPQKNKQIWDEAREAAREGRLDEIPSDLYIRYRSTFLAIYQEAKNKPVPQLNITLRPWQQNLVNILEGPVDTRKIYWYWERTGNVGKSWLATLLLTNYGATVLSTGKTADVAYLLDHPKIVVFDISRAQGMEHVNFSVMEDIKNGRIFSPKYESIIKAFDIPHIVVFANEPCPPGKFSADRLCEVEISTATPSNYATNFQPFFDNSFISY